MILSILVEPSATTRLSRSQGRPAATLDRSFLALAADFAWLERPACYVADVFNWPWEFALGPM